MALLELKIEPPPYRTPLYVDASRVLSKQWVNWFTNTINALLNASIDDIADLNNIVSLDFPANNNISNEINSIALNNSINIGNISEILSRLNCIETNNNISNCYINDNTFVENNLHNNNIQLLINSIQELSINILNYDFSQLIKDKIAILTASIGALATTTPITNTSINLSLTLANHRVLVDSTGGGVTITLPDCTLCTGKEFVVYGYAGPPTNTITVATTSSQIIKRISTDTATTDNINIGDAIYYVSQGTYWIVS